MWRELTVRAQPHYIQKLVLQQAASHSVSHKLGAAMQIQLVHDMCTMSIDGFGTDNKAFSNLVIRVPFGDKFEDFTLPLC